MQFNLFTALDNKGLINVASWLIIFILVSAIMSSQMMSFVGVEVSAFLNNFSFGFINKTKVNLQSSFKSYSGLVFKCFIIILFLKLGGLVPYIFSPTSQMVYVIIFSLVIWTAIIISSLVYLPIEFFGHLSPSSSPLWLVSLLNLIELVSNIIRPLTLTLRLSIKITTGHILLSLISSGLLVLWYSGGVSLSVVVMMLSAQYLVFELFVSLIQSFVYGLLLKQYLNDHSI